MASNFYRSQDSPEFLLGHGMEIMLGTFGLIAVFVLRYNYKRINEQRDREMESTTMTDDELSSLGDKAPAFRYKM